MERGRQGPERRWWRLGARDFTGDRVNAVPLGIAGKHTARCRQAPSETGR